MKRKEIGECAKSETMIKYASHAGVSTTTFIRVILASLFEPELELKLGISRHYISYSTTSYLMPAINSTGGLFSAHPPPGRIPYNWMQQMSHH